MNETVPVPEDHLFGVYARAPLEVERGEGAWLIDREGRRYLDFVQGIATNGWAMPIQCFRRP